MEKKFILSNFLTKLTGVASGYMHMNPVRVGFVVKKEEYLNSSSCDYYGYRKGEIELANYNVGLEILPILLRHRVDVEELMSSEF